MSPIKTVSQVLDAIQQAKAGATAFCTNFFPAQGKLQAWIDHQELFGEARGQSAFFFRKDGDFFHFSFAAASAAVLQRELATIPEVKSERLVADVVGNDAALGDLLGLLESAGFRRYRRLSRLSRAAQPSQAQASTASALVAADVSRRTFTVAEKSAPTDVGGYNSAKSVGSQVVWAERADRQAILDLLNRSFDHYADQIPMPYEIDAAIEGRQVIAIKADGALAALLFFETQGFTSTVRYWVVADEFQSRGFGSALIRHYFAAQSAVRRFILWVTIDNENAVQKYRHYGYAPDGLADHVLVNSMIPV